jgi:phage/plasmid primase-like uncharacterized protein
VAKQLRQRFPEKPFVIAGDNDVHLELTEGKNPDKEKALAAAKAIVGTVIFPIFAPGEQTYPANLEPVTPSKVRSGCLTDEQQQAIAKLKRYTDFNDLATNSVLGRESVNRQVTTKVNNIILCQIEQLVVPKRQKQKSFVEFEQQQHRQAIKM